MTLPIEVVKEDKRLTKAGEELAKLRWHWTLDKSNPARVGFREYARMVGRDDTAIKRHADGYAAWLAVGADDAVSTPGEPTTIGDFVELAKMNVERQEAAKAVAKHSGRSVSNVGMHHRAEIDAVVSTARERALDRGTKVEDEIERTAAWRERSRKAAERERDAKRKASTLRFIEIEGHIGGAMQRLRKVLDVSEGVEFTEEELELVVASLAKLRALLGLIDMRIAGTTDVDWDEELKGLVN